MDKYLGIFLHGMGAVVFNLSAAQGIETDMLLQYMGPPGMQRSEETHNPVNIPQTYLKLHCPFPTLLNTGTQNRANT